MHKTGRALVLGSAAIIGAFAMCRPALANVSLAVQPLVAEFNVQPGSSGVIKVTVSNSSTETERILVRRTDWRTIADGSIALEKVGSEHSHSITRDLSLSSYQFTLQAGERRDLTLSLAMPSSVPQSAGSYWGGFIINANDVNAPPSALGVAATVFVYNNIGTPDRTLHIQSLRVLSSKGNARLVARFRNPGTSYVRPVAHLFVGQGGRIYRDQKITISTVFPGATRIMSQDLGHLPAGEYRVELSIDYGGNSIIDAVTNAQVH